MNLRTKLVALSLLTLLLPWSGWKLLQELERFLREAQEGAMLASARTLASALPVGIQTRLLFLPELHLPLRSFPGQPVLDGDLQEWSDPSQGLVFTSSDGGLGVQVLAAAHQNRLYLAFDVSDQGQDMGSLLSRDSATGTSAGGIVIRLRNPRGMNSYTIRPEAPGPLRLPGDQGSSGQAEGFWLDRPSGYRVELLLPLSAADTDFSFAVQDSFDDQNAAGREAGPLSGNADSDANDRGTRWIRLVPEWQDLGQWFESSASSPARTWMVDGAGWVLADSGGGVSETLEIDAGQKTTWLQRLLYRLVAGSRTEVQETPVPDPVRLSGQVVQSALSGREAVSWSQDLETAMVWNTVAAPVVLQDEVRGAIVMQTASDGLLLVTNRALSRLLVTTMALTMGLAIGLWYFATRLSRRVQRLSGAVSQAMEDGMDPESLPLREDRDELGELARNNQTLLRAVADYSQYLQTLAGKLSHELKTPLAITRSSLDNLGSQELDPGSRRFLERAREGVDRQAAIVRAMSEASRLEASIGVADWERIDLAELVRSCVEAYRAVYEERKLAMELPPDSVMARCAPDLLAQALDKLIDNAMTLSADNDQVTVLLRPEGEVCSLAVRNTGSTLPDELTGRLFDSLVSVREKRGKSPHLGLGLYIVRLVAAAHDGGVSARNLPGGDGVEFEIRLPLH
jgi:dedicated sortase system histidine kinase